MSLATRCPYCNTLFKVTSVQLQQYGGKVKCGFCSQVFSGVEHLTPADADTWAKGDVVERPFADDLPVHEGALDAGSLSTSLSDINSGKTKSKKDLLELANRKKHIPWSSASKWRFAIFFVILVWQLVWWQRSAVTEQFPFADAPLTFIAELFGTQVTAPATKHIVIVGSAINNEDTQNLRADIRIAHRGKVASQWPVIQLVLLDSQQVVMDTVTLTPSDYAVKVSEGQDILPRVLPGQEFDLVAYFDTNALKNRFPDTLPTGFRLTVFDQNP